MRRAVSSEHDAEAGSNIVHLMRRAERPKTGTVMMRRAERPKADTGDDTQSESPRHTAANEGRHTLREASI